MAQLSHPMTLRRHLLSLQMVLSVAVCSLAHAGEPAQPVEAKPLHNVFKIEGGLYSGDAPENEEGFHELQKLGVKTIISVDGSQPNVELAHKYGMRYVHLPFGYDGVPQSRGVELAKAAQEASVRGPVYLHCHHGMHRGPAGMAVVCRTLNGWSAERAEEFLKQAGTSPDYAGLFRDVKKFQPPTAEELARTPANFPERTKPAPLVDAMVAIDEHFDALKAAQKAGWRDASGGAELKPEQTAALLWEAFRELGRDPETKKRGDDYATKMAESERATELLKKVLGDAGSESAARDAAVLGVAKSCGACHKAHRN